MRRLLVCWWPPRARAFLRGIRGKGPPSSGHADVHMTHQAVFNLQHSEEGRRTHSHGQSAPRVPHHLSSIDVNQKADDRARFAPRTSNLLQFALPQLADVHTTIFRTKDSTTRPHAHHTPPYRARASTSNAPRAGSERRPAAACGGGGANQWRRQRHRRHRGAGGRVDDGQHHGAAAAGPQGRHGGAQEGE